MSDNQSILLDLDYRKCQLTPVTYGIAFNFQRQLADGSAETRYSTPFSNVDQTVLRGSAVHSWLINDALNMKTSLVFDTRNLDILRNMRGNGVNAAGQLIRRSLRDQRDDVDYLTLQNKLNWAVNTG